jgi:type IV pilus biogenesis protein CpaD/CtpE
MRPSPIATRGRHPTLSSHAVRAAIVCLLVLTGCTQNEPYERPGMWRPIEANDTNLRAMIADPADLDMGRAATTSRGDAAAAAVSRLRAGLDKPLPASSISKVQVAPTDLQQAPTADGTAANPGAALNASSGGT